MKEKEFDTWQPFKWFCPNCGSLVVGYSAGNDRIKVSCSKCKTVMVRTVKGRHRKSLDIFGMIS